MSSYSSYETKQESMLFIVENCVMNIFCVHIVLLITRIRTFKKLLLIALCDGHFHSIAFYISVFFDSMILSYLRIIQLCPLLNPPSITLLTKCKAQEGFVVARCLGNMLCIVTIKLSR